MGRKAWAATEEDKFDILVYIERNYPHLLAEFRSCIGAEQINEFLQEEFTQKEIAALRGALRAKKRRARPRPKDANITISRTALHSLQDVCELDGITMSECIERYMDAIACMKRPDREQLAKR